ncbi:MAG: hypothetical protein HY506_00510 [Candidatus Yanofskybacteria bacterium]|nr:hypothetical protein [Candidatus Yanofskybacteria bacterium]
MDYHLYYHDDFDGMASGAVMLNFLYGLGDRIISFNPINFMPDLNKNWPKQKFKKPAILVDFRYHPAASWWFDHHETSFSEPALAVWKRNYRGDKQHRTDPSYKSCCSLILSHLVKNHNFRPAKHIKELAKWSDIIDGALYEYPEEIFKPKNAALKLNTYLAYALENKTRRIQLVKNLAFRKMEDIVSDGEFVDKIKMCVELTSEALKNAKRLAVLYGQVVFIDATSAPHDISHFMSYFVCPSAKYSVILEKEKHGYHLGVALNNWKKAKKHADISQIMLKYGGGGHKQVGATERKSRQELLEIAHEIIEYLNIHG